MINWFSFFKRSTKKERNFEWCIVGNIIDKHYWGEDKIIRRGTKQFGPGTKVYCILEFGDL